MHRDLVKMCCHFFVEKRLETFSHIITPNHIKSKVQILTNTKELSIFRAIALKNDQTPYKSGYSIMQEKRPLRRFSFTYLHVISTHKLIFKISLKIVF